MTIGEIHAKLLEVDDLLIKADLSQVPMQWDEYRSKSDEADLLIELLAKSTSELNGKSYEETRTMFTKERIINHMSAIASRHVELHPETNPKHDAIVAAAFQGIQNGVKTPEQGIHECMSIFAYLVQNGPKPPKRSFFDRLLGR